MQFWWISSTASVTWHKLSQIPWSSKPFCGIAEPRNSRELSGIAWNFTGCEKSWALVITVLSWTHPRAQMRLYIYESFWTNWVDSITSESWGGRLLCLLWCPISSLYLLSTVQQCIVHFLGTRELSTDNRLILSVRLEISNSWHYATSAVFHGSWTTRTARLHRRHMPLTVGIYVQHLNCQVLQHSKLIYTVLCELRLI